MNTLPTPLPVPSDSDRRKFSSYSVKLRSLGRPAVVDAEFKNLMHVLRVPSTKTFVCQLREGLTGEERELCEEYAFDLPRGAWAEYRHTWKAARLANRSYFEAQVFGMRVSFDFVEAELQMMLDTPVEADNPAVITQMLQNDPRGLGESNGVEQ